MVLIFSPVKAAFREHSLNSLSYLSLAGVNTYSFHLTRTLQVYFRIYCTTIIIYCNTIIIYCTTIIIYCTTIITYCTTIIIYCTTIIINLFGTFVVVVGSVYLQYILEQNNCCRNAAFSIINSNKAQLS